MAQATGFTYHSGGGSSHGWRRRLAANSGVELARGDCQPYVTENGDDIGIVAYTKFNGSNALSLVFDNRAALDASGWLMGQPLAPGIELNVCNNFCDSSVACDGEFCLPLLKGGQLGTCVPNGFQCRAVIRPGGVDLLEEPCATSPKVPDGHLDQGYNLAMNVAKPHLPSTCPGDDPTCYVYVKIWNGLAGWVPSGECGVQRGEAYLSCCDGERCTPSQGVDLAARLAAEAAASAAGAHLEVLRRRQAAAALNTLFLELELPDQLRRCSFGAAAGLDGLGADLLRGAFRWVEP
ncbi:hypothetical protein Rsub_06810 [Raphidocelis subcapitata]|uniref:Uncharacterized protein n=1 Tax=Raphidocelis subcapitata TaxID=307507 RepID=A0A2V0P970_9CHLO|nr:hypothetical protein Rsub_06810 [Raphidocelis subcapitata]|eukprot:GBF93707.1 hypothetical protein Rsub_06810 [Raphidocelis subcapitata]